MRLRSLASAALFALTVSYAHASTITYGPLTFGSDAPLDYPILIPDDSGGGGLLVLDTSGIRSGGGAGYQQSSMINSFLFDIDPGYAITAIAFINTGFDSNPIDTYGDIPHSDSYRASLFLCSSNDICSFGEYVRSGGSTTIPTLNSPAQPGAGHGILEVDADTFNISTTAYDFATVLIRYEPVTPVPEPSSLALLGTGLLGAVGVLRRRLAR